jgi:2-succinyl-5-enolpyruvyl-6-hydroxy-3-cyclohexene-1-carboxylate synthase
VIVGELKQEARGAAIAFLLRLGAPVYLEAQSGIREESSLDPLKIQFIENLWQRSEDNGYPIDGVLRIGGIPTARLWRDLEARSERVKVLSISENPFSGIAGASFIHYSFPSIFHSMLSFNHRNSFTAWQQADCESLNRMIELFEEEPGSEPSLIYYLSKQIPEYASVYLGNSLPIREWDLAAVQNPPHPTISVNRGANGIDGQIATFLGLCCSYPENWAIIGDLTALYDLAAPWIGSQMAPSSVNLVIVNNHGGQIFSKMFSLPSFVNSHGLTFKPLAELWNWKYECWRKIPAAIPPSMGFRLIELYPDQEATDRFYKKLKLL